MSAGSAVPRGPTGLRPRPHGVARVPRCPPATSRSWWGSAVSSVLATGTPRGRRRVPMPHRPAWAPVIGSRCPRPLCDRLHVALPPLAFAPCHGALPWSPRTWAVTSLPGGCGGGDDVPRPAWRRRQAETVRLPVTSRGLLGSQGSALALTHLQSGRSRPRRHRSGRPPQWGGRRGGRRGPPCRPGHRRGSGRRGRPWRSRSGCRRGCPPPRGSPGARCRSRP